MIDEKEIQRAATRIGEAANAERVILFGSYARGQAQEDSDVDLFVVADSRLPRFKRSRELYKLFRPYPFAMDLVVYTPQEVEKGSRSALSFVSKVLEEGKTLYVRGNEGTTEYAEHAERKPLSVGGDQTGAAVGSQGQK